MLEVPIQGDDVLHLEKYMEHNLHYTETLTPADGNPSNSKQGAVALKKLILNYYDV